MFDSDTTGNACEPEHGENFSEQTHWCRHLERQMAPKRSGSKQSVCIISQSLWVGNVGMTQPDHCGEMRLGLRLLEGSPSLEDLSG